MAPTVRSGAERQIVTWAAGLTAAAAIGYVVLGNYLPSLPWSRKIDKDVVPGLYNRYGNDCFANCIIQVPSNSNYRLMAEFVRHTFVSRISSGASTERRDFTVTPNESTPRITIRYFLS